LSTLQTVIMTDISLTADTMRYIHRVREKRGHSILGSRHNLDKFKHSFVLFLARIILTLQCIKTLETLSQHFKIVMWRWRHTWAQNNFAAFFS